MESLRCTLQSSDWASSEQVYQCPFPHVQTSMWKLESKTHTRSSLISGKEKARVPGRGKTDGFEFFCQLSILPCSVPSHWQKARRGFMFFKECLMQWKLWVQVGTVHQWCKSSGQHLNSNKSAVWKWLNDGSTIMNCFQPSKNNYGRG